VSSQAKKYESESSSWSADVADNLTLSPGRTRHPPVTSGMDGGWLRLHAAMMQGKKARLTSNAARPAERAELWYLTSAFRDVLFMDPPVKTSRGADGSDMAGF